MPNSAVNNVDGGRVRETASCGGEENEVGEAAREESEGRWACAGDEAIGRQRWRFRWSGKWETL